MITKPMLAGKVGRVEDLKFPLLATPKLDGIRALMIDQHLLSRNFKPIANTFTRNRIEAVIKGEVDGELILRNTKPCGAEFNRTSSAVMGEDEEPDVVYYIFDYVKSSLIIPYNDRMKDLEQDYGDIAKKHSFIKLILPLVLKSEVSLLEYEQKCLADGFEGVMVRHPYGPYKCGRSTEKEGYLLKLKRFEDGEAKIVGFEEKQHNENVAGKDAFGRTKRGQSMAGLVAAGTLGKILVVDVDTNVDFGIGTGFDDAMRQEIWNHRSKYLGKIVKYKHQACGSVDRPRFPVFLGFRDKRDMS